MKLFTCFLRIFGSDEKTVKSMHSSAMRTIYGESSINGPPFFEFSTWKDTPQIRITGVGEDKRCALCEYISEKAGSENIRKNNCPFFSEPGATSAKRRDYSVELLKKLRDEK